jgi:hypothetical protein
MPAQSPRNISVRALAIETQFSQERGSHFRTLMSQGNFSSANEKNATARLAVAPRQSRKPPRQLPR